MQDDFDWMNSPLGVEALICEMEKERLLAQLQSDPNANRRWDELYFKWRHGREKTVIDWVVESF